MSVSVVGTIRGRWLSTLRMTARAPAPPWGEVVGPAVRRLPGRAVVPYVARSRVKSTITRPTPRSRGWVTRVGDWVTLEGEEARIAGRTGLELAGGLELESTCNDRGALRRRPGRHWPTGRRRRR